VLGYNFHAYAALDYDFASNKFYLYNPYGEVTTYMPEATWDTGLTIIGRTESYAQAMGNGSTVTATSGRDVITGSTGNDAINTLAGDDFINGNGGVDWLTGGAGYDTFDLRSYSKAGSNDYAVVQDFWSAKDKIVLSGSERYVLGAVTSFDNHVTRSIFTSGNDLVAHLQGERSDLTTLTLSSSAFSFL
jgi:Ca2+-binding RTX toxin-like protein